jgi:DNA gyrase/topoisomerase IV subunit A
MLAPQSSQYINDQRREFSLYTIQSRALPNLADGLKISHRRVLWIARDGKHYKTASLAGNTMCIHPHSSPDEAINTLAAPYGNNIPLFDGDGAFGTFLIPNAYGASRYTAVQISSFTNDVIFKDIEIIPLINNYDDTLQEPKHFLPLVPVCLINPIEGIAIGFACNILPRTLKDIVSAQISFLKGKKLPDIIYPTLTPYNQKAIGYQVDPISNKIKWTFIGKFERSGKNDVKIVELPYGFTYIKFIAHLDRLQELGKILSYVDHSKGSVSITVTFLRGVLASTTDEDLIQLFKLTSNETENLNVIDFDGDTVIQTDFNDCIAKFTTWRLEWYVARYERLLSLIQTDIQRCRDILTAIKNNIGSIARKVESKTELVEYLEAINIVHIEYITSLPVYRFTLEEKNKTEQKLQAALITEQEYKTCLADPELRKNVYISELQDIQTKFCKK